MFMPRTHREWVLYRALEYGARQARPGGWKEAMGFWLEEAEKSCGPPHKMNPDKVTTAFQTTLNGMMVSPDDL